MPTLQTIGKRLADMFGFDSSKLLAPDEADEALKENERLKREQQEDRKLLLAIAKELKEMKENAKKVTVSEPKPPS